MKILMNIQGKKNGAPLREIQAIYMHASVFHSICLI